MSGEQEQPTEGELIFYETPEGTVRVEVFYELETFWMNQKRIAELFGVDVRTISEHLQNVYASGELAEEATIRKIRRVQIEGNRKVRREIEFYNLDAIISVGYPPQTGARQHLKYLARWSRNWGLAHRSRPVGRLRPRLS